MSQRIVQVPVSLIQELREAADVAYKGPEDTDPAMLRRYADNIRRGYQGGGSNLTAAVARVLDVVADALLSQPTPTAEPFRPAPDGWFTFGSHVGFDGPLQFSEERDEAGDPLWERHPEKPPEPPRIEDMAPGTTFRAALVGQSRVEQWMRVNTFHPMARMRDGFHLWPGHIDPSTIRDVIPPV